MTKYKQIVEGKLDLTQMTKDERTKELTATFKKIKECMLHNADKNGRPVFCILVTASTEEVSDNAN
jgi:hypothetical protein